MDYRNRPAPDAPDTDRYPPIKAFLAVALIDLAAWLFMGLMAYAAAVAFGLAWR